MKTINTFTPEYDESTKPQKTFLPSSNEDFRHLPYNYYQKVDAETPLNVEVFRIEKALSDLITLQEEISDKIKVIKVEKEDDVFKFYNSSGEEVTFKQIYSLVADNGYTLTLLYNYHVYNLSTFNKVKRQLAFNSNYFVDDTEYSSYLTLTANSTTEDTFDFNVQDNLADIAYTGDVVDLVQQTNTSLILDGGTSIK